MKPKKTIPHMTDFCLMPFGPHRGDQMSKVPALYLLSLVGSDELKKFPEVAEYINRAIRQLKAEAEKENVSRWRNGD